MSGRHSTSTRHLSGALLATALLAVLLAAVPSARAVTVVAPAVTLSNYGAGVPGVTYTFSGYTMGMGEACNGMQVTFPAGTVVPPADQITMSPPGTATVNGRTVTLAFSPYIDRGAPVSVSIGGITNPTAFGVYNVGNIVFRTVNPNNNQQRADQSLASADYSIAEMYISLTVETPDAGQSVDFGLIDPGVATPARQVRLTVDSSAPYTISRAVAGDATLLGLSVSGTATGPGPAGVATYTDAYTLNPPWTTTPAVPLVATVTYTVVQ